MSRLPATTDVGRLTAIRLLAELPVDVETMVGVVPATRAYEATGMLTDMPLVGIWKFCPARIALAVIAPDAMNVPPDVADHSVT
jgi:hypothetical protein